MTLRDTMFELLSYKYLEANWDGYDAIKPNAYSIAQAWKFLGVLIDNGISCPSVMISGSSEIGFYWKNDKYYVEIDIYRDAENSNEKGDFFS